MELILKHAPYYRVKRGQTLALIAETFRIPVSVLVKENALEKEVEEGQVLSIPASRFHLYRVRGGESKTLLCGSAAQFRELNATDCFYPGQIVFLG